ncbi:unnamed protein product [Porites lobata]|uniref:Reverse transcriptase zinc-binding domain-containing protein n=1 Tax=Porites lobata TaxID=104759 RepID=A0ABN8NVL2_9CNID|nr:unnamed protein product [Porites lobata]
MRMDETTTITALGEGKHYKFLGVLENVRQDERLALACAAKEYLRRISIIWSSPLSDCNRHWPLSELRDVDRAARKIIVENGGKHPAILTSLLYLSREKGGRGLRSVEHEYKITKIKSLLKLYQNSDQTVEAVREFKEHAMASGHQSLLKEAAKYAEELNITRQLDTLNPVCVTTEANVVTAARAGNLLKQSQEKQFLEIAKDKKWQGKLFRIRWEDESPSITSYFAWLKGWATCPTYTIAGMYELYEQLLPTKLYTKEKTQTSTDGEVLCRLCGKVAESVAHVLAGCSSLEQTKYLCRHNAALKILFFELLREHGLIEEVAPRYSPVMPKPAYQSTTSEAFRDIPIYADHNEVRANRIDARLVSHERKEVCTTEMSCPWIESRAKKDEEKTLKYGPMMWELKQRYNGYRVEQYNKVEAKKVKQAIYKARQHEIQSTVSEKGWQRKFIKNRWDDEKVKLEECFAWLSSWKNAQRIPSLEYKSFTNSCYLPSLLQQKNKTTNAAHAGIPWRMSSTFYLAVVH